MSTPERPQISETCPVLVSRQPVLDGVDRVVGYRLSYSLLSGGFPVVPSADEAVAIVDDVLSLIDDEERLLGSKAHLAFSREMLLRAGTPAIQPQQVLMRIRYEDAIAAPLMPVIERAASRGFELELDGLPGADVDLRLLENFSTIEVDVSRFNLEQAADVLTRARRHNVLALASGVSSRAERERARQLGFRWFTGRFFATPNLLGGVAVPIGDLDTIVELYGLQREGASLEQLVALIEQEVGLSVRLLRYINSAYFGFSSRVHSIKQAATMLGTRGLARWALIVAALSDSRAIPRELALITLARARACELVGLDYDPALDADELFTIGLLSTAAAVFQMPLERVLTQLPLAASVQAALLDHAGAAGDVLDAVIAYEQGEFLAPTLRATLLANAAAYREALDWARRAVYGIA